MKQKDNIQKSNNFAVKKSSNFTGLNNCIFVSCCNMKIINIEILSQQFPLNFNIGIC